MNLPDSANGWSTLIVTSGGAAFSMILGIWALGRGRMAERLLDTPAAKLKEAELRLEMKDQKIAHMEEILRVEKDHFKKIEEIRAQNEMDHKVMLAQIAPIAEHKADIAIRPTVEKMLAFEHRQERMERLQEDARKEAKEDIGKVFEKLEAFRKELMGAIQGASA